MNIYQLLANFNDMFGGAEITEFAIMVAMGPEKMKDGRWTVGIFIHCSGFGCHPS